MSHMQVLDRGSLLGILNRIPNLDKSVTLRPPKHVMVCNVYSCLRISSQATCWAQQQILYPHL
jgi:hypothetical protein